MITFISIPTLALYRPVKNHRDWILSPGTSTAVLVGLLGSLMYRSRLVPRLIPVMGLIGAPLLITAVFATLFGAIAQGSAWTSAAALPVAAWELSLGVWLVVKGFRPSPITTEMAAATAPATHRAIAV